MTNTILIIVVVIIQVYTVHKLVKLEKLFNKKGISETVFDDDYSNGDDDLYEEAKKIVLENGKASTSLLQRRLRTGYARSARLMDMLEERGIVGEADGANSRKVLVDK